MKFKVDSSVLCTALNTTMNVVDKRSQRPILSNSLLEIKENQLLITSSDLDLSVRVKIQVESFSEGRVCINPKSLFEILKELRSTEVEFEKSETNTLTITAKNLNYKLLTVDDADFPKFRFLENNDSKEFINLQAKDLNKILNKVTHAISSDESRANLNGVYLQQIEDKLRAVSSDGHRLALAEASNLENFSDNLYDGVIVPRKSIVEIKRITEYDLAGNIKMSVDNTMLYINQKDEYQLAVRLVAREYPKYEKIIPQSSEAQFIASKEKLTSSIKRIKVLSHEKSNGIILKLTNDQLEIIANHPDLGFAKEFMDVEYSGHEMEIGFNAKFLLDVMSILDGEEIIFQLNNEKSPVLIRTNSDANFLSIIMPLNL